MDIRVMITRDGSNEIKTMDLEEYLRGVVPSEMLTNWHMEAYKAQAVAARTFAQNKINYHIDKTYDVDDTTNNQAYKAQKIRDITDQAVLETCGEVLCYDGKVLKECLYCASNGGHCYSITEYGKWGGSDVPYLVSKDDPFTTKDRSGHGVGMSQWGAQARALEGQTYKGILAFYYPNTYIVNQYEQENNGDDEMENSLLDNQYVKFIEKNRCYIQNKAMTPKGIMVHSTGCEATPASQWYDRWNNSTISKAVHAFLDDKEIWQYLPWNICGWHAGGSANKTHIGFEICEPQGNLYNDEYFEKAYANAIKLCVYLCKMYGLSGDDIISHAEGHQLGVASNHGDVGHWFPYMGKTMDDFRADVDKAMVGEEVIVDNDLESMEYMKVVNVENYLNVRSEPDKDSTIIGSLEPEQMMKYLNEDGGWFKVRVLDGKYKDIEGWVYSVYVEFADYTPAEESQEEMDDENSEAVDEPSNEEEVSDDEVEVPDETTEETDDKESSDEAEEDETEDEESTSDDKLTSNKNVLVDMLIKLFDLLLSLFSKKIK